MEEEKVIKIGRLTFYRDRAIILVLSLLLALPFILNGQPLGDSLTYGMLTLLDLLLFALFIYLISVVGHKIFKGFVKIGTELSLLVLVAQGYCALAQKAQVSTDAIRALFIFVLCYVIYEFAGHFWTSFKELCLKFKESNKWSGRGIFFVSLLILFVVYFFFLIYQAVMPLFITLCFVK